MTGLFGAAGVATPVVREDRTPVYHQYVVRVRERDAALALLREREIGCGVFYPKALHQQQCFAEFVDERVSCPEAERACEEVLALPIYPELTTSQQDEVFAALRDHTAALR